MQPSRRTAIRLLATVPLGLLAGCSVREQGSTDTPTPTMTADGASVEARLDGPETSQLLYDDTDIESVGSITEQHGAIQLPVTLTDAATADMSETFRTAGVTANPDAFEVVQRHDGTVVGRFNVEPSLAGAIAEGEWDGEFRMTFTDREQATEIRAALVGDGTETDDS